MKKRQTFPSGHHFGVVILEHHDREMYLSLKIHREYGIELHSWLQQRLEAVQGDICNSDYSSIRTRTSLFGRRLGGG